LLESGQALRGLGSNRRGKHGRPAFNDSERMKFDKENVSWNGLAYPLEPLLEPLFSDGREGLDDGRPGGGQKVEEEKAVAAFIGQYLADKVC